MPEEIHFYGAIEKFDDVDGSLLVTGIASTEDVDNAGETVTADAMRKALPDYILSGTVREMHQPIAAGRPVSAYVDDEGRTHLTAKIVDQGTIDKIKAKVLKGFSIGGKALNKIGKTITALTLKDVSVVDVPCNPNCVFEIIKFDKPGDKCSDADCKNHHESAVEKCDMCKSKMHKNEEYMSAEAIKKIDDLTTTVNTLAKTVETLTQAQPVTITKLQSDVDALTKRAKDTEDQILATERTTIIRKMDGEGRVAFKPEGVAYTMDELQKMDLPVLRILAVNSPMIPMQARTIYKGGSKPGAVDPKLKGADKVEKAWEHQYDSLEAMRARNQN